MRNKAIFLATTAVALLTGAGAAQAGDLYVSVFGGLNNVIDSSGTFETFDSTDTIEFSSDSDTGFVVGGTIGTHLDKWAQGLRVEVEASYRRNDLKGSWVTATPDHSTGGTLDGNMSTFAIMANAWYDIELGTKVKPYIGGGLGWARSKGDAVFLTTFTSEGSDTGLRTDNNDSRSGFAWQLGLGFNYEVAPNVDVGLGYRYFKGPKVQDEFFDGKAKFENGNHAVQASITIGIN